MRHPQNSQPDDSDNTPEATKETRSGGDQGESQQIKTYIGKVIGGLDAARRFQELISQTLKLKKNH